MEQHCTLSNDELIAKCDKWIHKLAESGGKDWVLSVPVDFNKDPDMLFTELCNRLKATTQPPSAPSVNGLNEFIHNVAALVYYSQIHTVNGVVGAEFPTHADAWKAAQKWIWNNCIADEYGVYRLKAASTTQGAVDPEALTVADYEQVLADHDRLVREIDVILNGEDSAKQASLCDLIGQIRQLKMLERTQINIDAGMPELEASFQVGYSSGVEMAGKRASAAQGAAVTESQSVYVACAYTDPQKCGEFTSQDGQTVFSVRETQVPVVMQGAVWVKEEYDRLYDQIKGGKQTVCYVDYYWKRKDETGKPCRGICTIRKDRFEFSAHGVSYGYPRSRFDEGLNERQSFIAMCDELNVEWLDETGSQRQQAGPVWVRASERLPEFGGHYFVKVGRLKDKLCWTRTQIIELLEEKENVPVEWLDEWLDESQPTPSKESDAVDFLEWVAKMGYRTEKGLWYIPSDEHSTHDTTSQLYQQFKNRDAK